jgi:hypothetical protein
MRWNYRMTEVCEDGNNRLGKVSNRRWEKTEEWELLQERQKKGSTARYKSKTWKKRKKKANKKEKEKEEEEEKRRR